MKQFEKLGKTDRVGRPSERWSGPPGKPHASGTAHTQQSVESHFSYYQTLKLDEAAVDARYEPPEAHWNSAAQPQRERSGLSMGATDVLSSQQLYHGTRADLKLGDLIEAGRPSNFGTRKKEAGYVYLTGNLETAAWGAELALGEGSGRIYTVDPTGPIEDDPNLTKDGVNPTESYRSQEPLRVTGECKGWQGHSPELIQAMKDRIVGLEPIPGS
jgi:hypothetical protein